MGVRSAEQKAKSTLSMLKVTIEKMKNEYNVIAEKENKLWQGLKTAHTTRDTTLRIKAGEVASYRYKLKSIEILLARLRQCETAVTEMKYGIALRLLTRDMDNVARRCNMVLNTGEISRSLSRMALNNQSLENKTDLMKDGMDDALGKEEVQESEADILKQILAEVDPSPSFSVYIPPPPKSNKPSQALLEEEKKEEKK